MYLSVIWEVKLMFLSVESGDLKERRRHQLVCGLDFGIVDIAILDFGSQNRPKAFHVLSSISILSGTIIN